MINIDSHPELRRILHLVKAEVTPLKRTPILGQNSLNVLARELWRQIPSCAAFAQERARSLRGRSP